MSKSVYERLINSVDGAIITQLCTIHLGCKNKAQFLIHTNITSPKNIKWPQKSRSEAKREARYWTWTYHKNILLVSPSMKTCNNSLTCNSTTVTGLEIQQIHTFIDFKFLYWFQSCKGGFWLAPCKDFV